MNKKNDFLPDTNTVLRYLLNDIPEQFARSEVFFEKVRNGKVRAVILESVLVECLYILTKYYKVSRDDAARTLTGLLCYKGTTNPDKTVLTEALRNFASTDLDPVDCLLLAHTRAHGLQLFSFDKKLNKAAGLSEQPERQP